jgi:uncharacterized membrane protein (UPF0127 family)
VYTTAPTTAAEPAPSPTEPTVTVTVSRAPTTADDEVAEDVVVPEGFTTVTITITEPDGTTHEYCVSLAADMRQYQRGLQHVTDLGGATGMLFAYERDSEGRFWMHNTPMPLSMPIIHRHRVNALRYTQMTQPTTPYL